MPAPASHQGKGRNEVSPPSSPGDHPKNDTSSSNKRRGQKQGRNSDPKRSRQQQQQRVSTFPNESDLMEVSLKVDQVFKSVGMVAPFLTFVFVGMRKSKRPFD